MRSNLIHHALPSTLRMRLLLLVLALIPALVFIFIITVRARQSVIEDVAATTRQLTELAASSQEQLIARVGQLLVTLSHLPEVRSGKSLTSKAGCASRRLGGDACGRGKQIARSTLSRLLNKKAGDKPAQFGEYGG
jgi:hypothetical protein